MVTGFDYVNLLKIGFLNAEDEWLRDEFLQKYDVIIDSDGDFSFVLECLNRIVEPNVS
jgi:hypothetical protein